MGRRVALSLLAFAIAAALPALLLPGPFADWTFALATVLSPVALMALGASGPRGLGAAGWALAALFAVLGATALGVLALARTGETATVAGFPVAAVIPVVGLWLLPLPIASLAYALTFERTGIGSRDLEELRARSAAGAWKPSPERPDSR